MGLNKARPPPLGTAKMFLKCQRQPASLPSSAMFHVMGIDFRHCFRADVPLQLVRHAGPTLTRGLAPAASGIVPGKAESGLPRPVFLTHWDSINGSSSQHFCSFNTCVSRAPTRRKGSLKRGKTEELLQSLVQTRVKEDKNVNMLRSLYLLTFAGGAVIFFLKDCI